MKSGIFPAGPHYTAPVPGALTAFAGRPAADSVASGSAAARESAYAANPWLVPGTTDASHRLAGVLDVGSRADSVVVTLEGDDRTGYRMKDFDRTYHAMKGLTSGDPLRMLFGIPATLYLGVEAIVPQLDGPRDVFTRLITRHPQGGRAKQVLSSMERVPQPDLLIDAGDMVFNGRRGRLWEEWVDQHRELRSRVPLVAAPGNHERIHDPVAQTNWNLCVGLPAQPRRYWYALDLPDSLARFVILDSNPLSDVKHNFPDALEEQLSDEQLSWCDSVLATRARYRFVVLHHPLVSMGHYPREWLPDSAGDPVPVRRARLLEICSRRGVTAILAGHEHLYYRVFLRRADRSGFWHITSGGGGGPLYPIDAKNLRREQARTQPAGLALDAATAWVVSKYHFCRLVLLKQPGGPLRFDVYESLRGGKIRLIQRFDLSRPPGGS